MMSGHTQLAMTARDTLMQMAQQEMSAFERREAEFRRKEREQRASELHMPSLGEAGKSH
jgi:hypothetical protein